MLRGVKTMLGSPRIVCIVDKQLGTVQNVCVCSMTRIGSSQQYRNLEGSRDFSTDTCRTYERRCAYQTSEEDVVLVMSDEVQI